MVNTLTQLIYVSLRLASYNILATRVGYRASVSWVSMFLQYYNGWEIQFAGHTELTN